MSTYHATFETPNFLFEAYGATTKEAIAALETGLLKHADQYRLAADWWRSSEDDIVVRAILHGACYRDREKLTQMQM